MSLKKILNKIKEVFAQNEDKVLLNTLIENLEQEMTKDENLPFRVKRLKMNGFGVKIYGLHGFIHFKYMPWKYANYESWESVFPYIKNKVFFGRIFKLVKEPFSLTLNGQVAQFKAPNFIKDQVYDGIIIKKYSSTIQVDLGYGLNWDSGSITEYFHRSNFYSKEFENLECSGILQAYYRGESDDKKLIFEVISDKGVKVPGFLEDLIGKIVRVRIKKNENNQFTYLVEDKYQATLVTKKSFYEERKKYVYKALSNLNDGEIIHCEVIDIDPSNHRPDLKWVINDEIDHAFNRSATEINSNNPDNNIITRIGDEVLEKLQLIGKQVDVEVNKIEQSGKNQINKYLINNKFNGELIIINDNFTISSQEKLIIENNLQDKQILKCTIKSINKNTAHIVWKISDFDYHRLAQES